MTMPDPAPATSPRQHALAANTGLRRSRSVWRIVAVIALIVAVIAVGARLSDPANGLPKAHIARIAVTGAIATDRARLAAIKDLAEDDSVSAVIVTINSPGGTTAGGEELYEALSALRAAKPVVAVIEELGASAAYMTAIATDRIFARRLSVVGSIGVLYQHVDAGKLLDTIGIDLDKVASGPLKAEPDYDEAMSPEVRASINALVTDSFNWFVDIVAERRGLDRPAALALADGRIVSGRMALESRLVDALGGEAEAIAWLESEREVAADLPVATVYPLPPEGLERFARFFGETALGAIGLSPNGTVALDGLVSLWQAGASL